VVARRSGRLCVHSGDVYPSLLQQSAGAARGLKVSLLRTFGFLSNVLRDLFLEPKIGHQPLQPVVFNLRSLRLRGLHDFQAAVFLAVSVVALVGQISFLASLGNALALALFYFQLPQLRDDLLGRQLRPRHRLCPFGVIFSQFTWFR
jgi:hypothetical protein